MDLIRKNWRLPLVGLLLAASTVSVFWPVTRHDFINLDDPAYITLNPYVSSGLTWHGIAWAFTGHCSGNWHPLTWLSHMADVQLFGPSPLGPHLVNLLLHTTNSVLLLLLLRQMTQALWRSAFAAALFALHPLHVESVAWAAERKDVLSSLFFMLTLLAYARYSKLGLLLGGGASTRHYSDRAAGFDSLKLWYLLSLSLFTFGLMSKPMLVTLPCVLLLLDYWPLERFSLQTMKLKLPRLLMEKLPFFVLSVASSIATVTFQHLDGAVIPVERVSLASRLANAMVAYCSYLKQIFWPVDLSIFYPLSFNAAAGRALLAAMTLLSITAGAVFMARRRPYLLVGWLWYLGMLVPVIGLVQVGMQARADRYTYLPSIGIFIVLVWGAWSIIQRGLLFERRVEGSLILVGGALALQVTLAVSTGHQLGYWRNSRSLFQHAVEIAANNYVAWKGLALANLESGDTSAALSNFYRALECAKRYGTDDGNNFFIGATLQLQGRGLEALQYLEQAKVAPEQEAEKDYRLGLSLTAANRLSEAEVALKHALEAKPEVPEFQLGMAALLEAQGRTTNAELMFRQTVLNFPANVQAHKSLADFLALHNRAGEAAAHYREVVARKPDDAKLRCAYAAALARSGNLSEATAQLQAALTLSPTNAQTHFDLAELLSAQGRDREAIAHYDQALALEPRFPSALNNLAWLLATAPQPDLRDGARAVELATSACEFTQWKQPFLLGTLAAAYAEAGRFSEAVEMGKRARDQAKAAQMEDVAKRNGELLESYQQHKPYHEQGSL